MKITKILVAAFLIGQCLLYSCHKENNHIPPVTEETKSEEEQPETGQPEEQQPEEQPEDEQPEEPQERERIGKVEIGFSSVFTPDLLDLVTPIVKYKDKDGEHEVRLTKDACTHDVRDIDIDGEIFQYDRYKWAPTLVCDMFSDEDIDETISLRFESNDVAIDTEREYELYASAGVNRIDKNFSYNGTLYLGSSSYTSITIKITIGDDQSHDDDIYTGELVQKYIDELVKSPQTFHVEVSRDGNSKLNGR